MLLLVVTVLLTLVAAVATAIALGRRRPKTAAMIVVSLAAWYVIHLGVVAAVSAREPERRLAPCEVKRFCGFYLDCHIGVAVVGRRRAGTREIVTLEISSTARAATLRPYGLHAVLLDDTGRRYEREGATPLEEDLGPGESYRRELVYDVPEEARHLVLDVRERGLPDDWIELFLAGDDDSFLHKPVLLILPPSGV
jgi:hypothetical protein